MNRQVVGEVKNVEELCSVTWRVPEIDCASCEQRVTSKLAETEGIEDVEASSRSTKINLKYDTTIIYKKEIKSVIKNLDIPYQIMKDTELIKIFGEVEELFPRTLADYSCLSDCWFGYL